MLALLQSLYVTAINHLRVLQYARYDDSRAKRCAKTSQEWRYVCNAPAYHDPQTSTSTYITSQQYGSSFVRIKLYPTPPSLSLALA
jgi:hypothetical protein